MMQDLIFITQHLMETHFTRILSLIMIILLSAYSKPGNV